MARRYFSYKELFLGIAGTVWLSLLAWFFLQSEKTWGDILVNAINDICFAVFVVLFVDYANEKNRIQLNQSRRRAVAWAVYRFNSNVASIIQGMIFDGIASSHATSIPTTAVVEDRAKSLHAKVSVPTGDFKEQPLPYGAFFITKFAGESKANVYPARKSSAWLIHLAGQLDDLYMKILQIDSGFVPDDVVDALTRLKDDSLVLFCRNVLDVGQPFTWGHWPEDVLATTIHQLEIVEVFVAEVLDSVGIKAENLIASSIESGLVLNSRGSLSWPAKV